MVMKINGSKVRHIVYTNEESRKSWDFTYSARDFAFNKLLILKISRNPPTYARDGAVKSQDLRDS